MTKINQLKILDNKTNANKAQYYLDRKKTETSALSSGELEKYEYSTEKYLGIKPDVTQKEKCECSPRGKVFNKELDESDKKEGLLKRLKNIEDQPKTNKKEKYNHLGIKSISYAVKEELSQKAKDMLNTLSNQEKLIDYRKLYFRGGYGIDYDFSNFNYLRDLFRAIHYGETTRTGAEKCQSGFDSLLNQLKAYAPQKSEYVERKENLLINAKNFLMIEAKMVIDAFKNKIFPLDNPDDFPTYVSKKDRSSISEDFSSEDELSEMITKKDKAIKKELFKRYFTFQSLIDMQKTLSKTQNKQANRKLVRMIESGLIDLGREIKKMS